MGTTDGSIQFQVGPTLVFDGMKYLVSYIACSLLHKYTGHVPRVELQTTVYGGKILRF